MAKKLAPTAPPDSLAGRLLKRLPGGAFVKEQLDRVETLALGELKQRLNRLEQDGPSVSVVAVSVTRSGDVRDEAPGTLLRRLQEASGDQDHVGASDAFYAATLRAMVPDQVRILAALSDGTAYPVIHLMAVTKLGLSAVPMLEYVSSVGRAAGTMAPEMTAPYVRQMAALGLTETGPEDLKQGVQYEILETDDTARKVMQRIEKNGERCRIVRRSLRISDFGLAMWHRCQLDDDLP